ncbi:MAG: limonene-1,2-epoxide hydrolase family protein [Sphingomonadaceae bacterium]
MNSQKIIKFVEYWNLKDIDSIVSCFTNDGYWENIPIARSTGKEEIRSSLVRFLGQVDKVRWTIDHISENADGTVLTERMDGFVMNSGAAVDLPVMGIFEMRDGLIAGWRDYFDLGTLQKQMAG